MGLIDRVRLWSEIQRVRPAEESPDISGGRDAELLLKELVGSAFHFQDANVFAGRRIPSKRQGRRREIDLIVCTPKMIHLIEIKNWSGRLDVRDGVWCQTRRNGQVVEHPDMFETNRQRLDAVVEYLHGHGVPLGEPFVSDHIVPEIIFMNPRLELERAIEDRPDVISRRELDDYLGRQRQRGRAERMFSSLIDALPRPGIAARRDFLAIRRERDSARSVPADRRAPVADLDVGSAPPPRYEGRHGRRRGPGNRLEVVPETRSGRSVGQFAASAQVDEGTRPGSAESRDRPRLTRQPLFESDSSGTLDRRHSHVPCGRRAGTGISQAGRGGSDHPGMRWVLGSSACFIQAAAGWAESRRSRSQRWCW